MYTLLLVDDEEDVIEVIERKVSWEQIGFHVVGHAGNGFKALEMMEDMQPDVVMTDIRMPYMDGLELCSNIRQRFPATKLLLFTGFDDFEYAKEAVHLEIEEYILKPLNLADELSNFEPVVLKQWLLDFSSRLHDDMADARYNSKKSLIDSAKDYVHRNYRSMDLGLDDTCKELGVSNSYFSSLFKKETGSSFVEYLTDYRMDKAARMLVETDDKSYVIAQNVGYADPNYFSYVFKRKYGVSPSRYRTEYEKNKV